MVNSNVDDTFTISHSKSTGLEVGLDILFGDLLSLLSTSKNTIKSSQIQDLLETKGKTEKELDEAKTALSGYCQKVYELKEEYERLRKNADDLTNHDQIVSQKKTDLENELKMLSKVKANPHDEELVEKNKLLYKCVRNMTQVRFTYDNSDKEVLQGYVFNKITKKIVSFSFNIAEKDCDHVVERIMKLMRDTSHPNFKEFSLE